MIGVFLKTLKSNAKKVFLRIDRGFCLGVSAAFLGNSCQLSVVGFQLSGRTCDESHDYKRFYSQLGKLASEGRGMAISRQLSAVSGQWSAVGKKVVLYPKKLLLIAESRKP